MSDPVREAVARALHGYVRSIQEEYHGVQPCNVPEFQAEDKFWAGQAIAALRAAYEALEREGWQVVPSEATQKMMVNGGVAHRNALKQGGSPRHSSYRAMLASAPKPPGAE